MANVIGMTQRGAILGLWRRQWSHRRIARELELNRRTVARYIEAYEAEQAGAQPGDSKCTIVPPGKTGSKCTIPPPGKLGRQSHCEPYSEQIKLALEKGLSAQRILCGAGKRGQQQGDG